MHVVVNKLDLKQGNPLYPPWNQMSNNPNQTSSYNTYVMNFESNERKKIRIRSNLERLRRYFPRLVGFYFVQ